MNESITFTVKLSKEELVLIHNALNEIINGAYAIPNEDFHTHTGSTIPEARDLLKKISDVTKTATL
jgi:hypothetical protein